GHFDIFIKGGQFNEKKSLCCCHRFVPDPFWRTCLFSAARIHATSKRRTAGQARHSDAYACWSNGSSNGRKNGTRRDVNDAAIVERRSKTSRCDDADARRDDENSRGGNEQDGRRDEAIR